VEGDPESHYEAQRERLGWARPGNARWIPDRIPLAFHTLGESTASERPIP
jgi:hypothetical protein